MMLGVVVELLGQKGSIRIDGAGLGCNIYEHCDGVGRVW